MISYKTKAEIAILRQGGQILASILHKLAKETKEGVSSVYLEEMAIKMISEAGGQPAFKDYEMGGGLRFPSALCVSINDEIVHGASLPPRVFRAGDLVSLDIGMKWGGLYTDTAITVAVGKVSRVAKKLIEVTKKALALGISQAKLGNSLDDIGQAISLYAEKHGYGVVRDLVGHGVGHQAHEEPDVFNYPIGKNSPENLVLREGLVIAIEPMITAGDYSTRILPNGYTFSTADGSLCAHFEHSIAITEKGPLILTAL